MAHVQRMLSLRPDQAEWLHKNDVNLSIFVRRALEIAIEQDSRDISDIVEKLRLVNRRLNELLAAYQMDAATKKESVR